MKALYGKCWGHNLLKHDHVMCKWNDQILRRSTAQWSEPNDLNPPGGCISPGGGPEEAGYKVCCETATPLPLLYTFLSYAGLISLLRDLNYTTRWSKKQLSFSCIKVRSFDLLNEITGNKSQTCCQIGVIIPIVFSIIKFNSLSIWRQWLVKVTVRACTVETWHWSGLLTF